MSLMTLAPATTGPADDTSYEVGYLDGQLDAHAQTPSALIHDRASMADAYDPDWAQGYIDGYLDQIHANTPQEVTPS